MTDMTAMTVTYEPRLELEQVEPVTITPDSAFVTSLRTRGQLTPIRVTRNGNGVYHIINGNRRVAALRQLGEATVRAEVVEHNELEDAKDTLVENLLRSRHLASEAHAVSKLVDAGMSPEDIGRELGVNLRVVKELCKLYRGLTPKAFALLRQGKLSRSAAVQMLKLPRRDQQELVRDGEAPRIKDVQAAVRGFNQNLLQGLEQVQVNTVAATPTATPLAAQLELFANRLSGSQRRTLIDAAAILREQGEVHHG